MEIIVLLVHVDVVVIILYRIRVSIVSRSLNKIIVNRNITTVGKMSYSYYRKLTYVIIFFVVVSRGRVYRLVAIVGWLMSFVHNRFVFIGVMIVGSVMAVSVMSRLMIIHRLGGNNGQ